MFVYSTLLQAFGGGGFVRPKGLTGGINQCVNNKDASGAPIDPITLAPIPLNRLIRVPVLVQYDNPPTDFFCFDRTALLAWLKISVRNPFIAGNFTRSQLWVILNQLNLRPKYTWPDNGFRSFFSHSPQRSSDANDESPWPEQFRQGIMGYLDLEI